LTFLSAAKPNRPCPRRFACVSRPASRTPGQGQ
jgi:hypothetical protein